MRTAPCTDDIVAALTRGCRSRTQLQPEPRVETPGSRWLIQRRKHSAAPRGHAQNARPELACHSPTWQHLLGRSMWCVVPNTAAQNSSSRPSRSGSICRTWVASSGTLIALALASCNFMPTPRIEDAPAPRDYYRLANPSDRKCSRDVPILDAGQSGGRPYRELKTISATCYPGTPGVCEQTLLERACELDADALLLVEPQALGSPAGASTLSSTSMTARALRWEPAAQPRP